MPPRTGRQLKISPRPPKRRPSSSISARAPGCGPVAQVVPLGSLVGVDRQFERGDRPGVEREAEALALGARLLLGQLPKVEFSRLMSLGMNEPLSILPFAASHSSAA